jgi:hypothetical protein
VPRTGGKQSMLASNLRRPAAWGAALHVSMLAALAAPPKLESATPDQADAVDAEACKEIVLRFDQPMSNAGQSICGGGAEFPAFAGKPFWRDDRTFVMPVKLEPGHAYSFSVNCPAARNFRSAIGEPAEIQPIAFRTLAPGEATLTLEPQQAALAFDRLRTDVLTRYSHRDRLQLDWRAEFAAAEPGFRAATTPAAFARAAAALLSRARDPHISVQVGAAFLPTCRRDVTPNFDPQRLAATVPNLTRLSETVWTGAFPDGVGYILVTGWPGGPDGARALEPAAEALTKFAAAPGLIVDVRPNGGGDELAARSIAARFIDKPRVYSRNDVVDPDAPGGFTGMIDRIVEPAPAGAGPRVTATTAVLIGPACLSSNESFIAMMRPGPASPGERSPATLVGATTGGSSGNPRPFDLGIDATVMLPSWRDYLVDGTPLEGRGITPDIAVDWAPGRTDPVVEAALAWLRGPKPVDHRDK